MKRRDFWPLLITVFLLFFAWPLNALASDFNIKYIVPDKAGKTLFIGGHKKNKSSIVRYKVIRLDNPYRMVVDIHDSVLLKKYKNTGEEIKVAQFSNNPDIVRVVFTAKSPKALDKVKVRAYKNSIVFDFDKVELTKDFTPSIYRDKNKEELTPCPQVKLEKTEADPKQARLDEYKEKLNHNIIIKAVERNDNRILLSGSGFISVSDPFILEDPNRIIFDIPDAVVDSADLIQEFTLKNKDIVKIGQFDPKTIRIVITSKNPKKYKNAISPDLQSIIISPAEEMKFAEFPDNKSLSSIQEIKIVKNEDGLSTKILIITEKPVIHSVQRFYSPDTLHLNLYNLKEPPKEMIESLEKTPQFHGFCIDKKSLVLSLNKSTTIESKLSLDGRILQLTLIDNIVFTPVFAGKGSGRIVIDPGHGGYDSGAHYNGVYEKDITLDVSKRIKKYLDEAGFYVILTRETDKTVSLRKRVQIANKINPDIFLSVHVNASESTYLRGIETYWYSPRGKVFAKQVHTHLVNNVRNTNDNGIRNARFYVIRNTKAPAILVEMGYMSNEVEMYQLMTDERRETTARSIAQGIIDYMSKK